MKRPEVLCVESDTPVLVITCSTLQVLVLIVVIMTLLVVTIQMPQWYYDRHEKHSDGDHAAEM